VDRISWAQPDDVDFTKPAALPEGNHRGGNLALFADGSVRFLERSMSAAQIRDAATISGGKAPSPSMAPAPPRTPAAPRGVRPPEAPAPPQVPRLPPAEEPANHPAEREP